MCPCQSNCNKIYGFEELCQLTDGKPLQKIDEITYAASILCRDHEKLGFIEEVKDGMNLTKKLNIS